MVKYIFQNWLEIELNDQITQKTAFYVSYIE